MNPLDEALAATTSRKGPACGVGKFLAVADPKVRARFEEVRNDSNVQSAHLARALAALAGHGFAGQQVTRHREGKCTCGS